MKYSQYQKDMDASKMPQQLKDILLGNVSIWTNDACYGYIIMAMEDEGFDEKSIRNILRRLHDVFDQVSPEEAEKHYKDW